MSTDSSTPDNADVGYVSTSKIIAVIIAVIVGTTGVISGYILGRSSALTYTYTIYFPRNMTYTIVETLTKVYKEYVERSTTYTVTTTKRETVTNTKIEEHTLTHTERLTITSALPPTTVTVTETHTTPVTIVEPVTYVKTVVSTVTYTPTTPPSEIFRIITSSVTIRDSIPCIHIMFTTTTSVIIDLIGPDGTRIDTVYPLSGETGAYLKMSKSSATPMKGAYRIIAWKEEFLGRVKKINETIMTFRGYDIKIADINLKKSWSAVIGGSIDRIDMILVNTGDLPTFLKELRVYILNINMWTRVPVQYETLWPSNESRYLSIPTTVYLSRIPEGVHQLKIELVNDLDEIMATYTTTLTFP